MIQRKTPLRFSVLVVLLMTLVFSGVSLFAMKFTHAIADSPSPKYVNNPFPGSPNCTQYVWQQIHDREGIDLQVWGNPNQWLSELKSDLAHAAWSYKARSWVQIQLDNPKPAINDIVVVPKYLMHYSNSPTGHVAVVDQPDINGDTRVFSASQQDYGSSRVPPTYSFTWHLDALAPISQSNNYFIHISNKLATGQTLNSGQSLTADNGIVFLAMQSDGNLVEYVSRTGRVLWASNTSGHPGTHLVNQPDGNLVLYAPGNRAIWATNTYSQQNLVLVVQGDGNVVLYTLQGRAVWATGTNSH